MRRASRAYPICSFTWLLMPQQWQDSGKEKAMVGFLNWMLTDGQKEVTKPGLCAAAAECGGQGKGGGGDHPVAASSLVHVTGCGECAVARRLFKLL